MFLGFETQFLTLNGQRHCESELKEPLCHSLTPGKALCPFWSISTEIEVNERCDMTEHPSKSLCPYWSYQIATEIEVSHRCTLSQHCCKTLCPVRSHPIYTEVKVSERWALCQHCCNGRVRQRTPRSPPTQRKTRVRETRIWRDRWVGVQCRMLGWRDGLGG